MKITVARYNFMNDLTKLINECGLPAFVVGDILKECLGQVNILAQQQLEADMKEVEEDGTTESDIHG